MEIYLADYNPLSGSSYSSLPEKIANMKAVINMKNQDHQCLWSVTKWSVTRALNLVDTHAEQITDELKDQSEKLNWSGLEFPVELSKIGIFEKNNPEISVNVLGYDDVVHPLRNSKMKRTQVVNLLLIQKHYCVIMNMSRLLSSQVSKHNKSKVFCLSCLNHFPNEEKLSIPLVQTTRQSKLKCLKKGELSHLNIIIDV